MTLDPDLHRMLERSRAAGGPPLQAMAVEEARAAMREMFLSNGYPIHHAAEVTSVPAQDCGGFALHLYRPKGVEGPLPALVYFHGGGFVLGDAAAYDTHSRALAHLLGVTVVFVEYRLAPEHRFPAALEDAQGAMDWLADKAPDLGIDTARMVLMGESAGGNLAVNAALHARAKGRISFRGLTLIYPVTDMRPFTGSDVPDGSLKDYASGVNLDMAEMQWFCETYLNTPAEGGLPENTLFGHPGLAGLPPTRIYTAECDPLRDMGMNFALRLTEQGVRAHAECLPGMLHSFMCHGSVSPRALRHFFRIVEDISAQFAYP
ncbi:alpha/beta hydrolase [Pukyongiella litopenaei]|uniref:Alpha/beta hydrolase n=1 Tax=Pukyongiella litopenaei TaxID=2605946 RepID=A0A2S0MPY0_9RHOB|nr:alpha/beta hydrolase [Pukyongiella litopenaei]AVO37950.1 alpha/beta hydrolase [Pukyongiella litopenaei]